MHIEQSTRTCITIQLHHCISHVRVGFPPPYSLPPLSLLQMLTSCAHQVPHHTSQHPTPHPPSLLNITCSFVMNSYNGGGGGGGNWEMETVLNHARWSGKAILITFLAINDVFGYKRHGIDMPVYTLCTLPMNLN